MVSPPTFEIAIVLYPGAQLSAVQGLTDLFEIADSLAAQHHEEPIAFLRVSQWRQEAPGQVPVRVPDARKANDTGGGADAGRGAAVVNDADRPLAVILLPPSLAKPQASQDPTSFVEWLLGQHRSGATLGSICSGAFLLGETGLLTGRSVTTHWALAEMFRQRFPNARLDADRLVIDDGDIISAGGMMAWIDLGLKLVDRFLGPTVMLETARFLLVDPPGREQRYYSAFSPDLTHGDAAVLKVQHWLQASGAKDMTLATLASRAGLEERTFLRRFRKATGLTAIDYCQRLRVGKARERLQFSRTPIDAIAWEVGYSDPGSFRKVFAKVTGLTPSEYRKRFCVSQAKATEKRSASTHRS